MPATIAAPSDIGRRLREARLAAGITPELAGVYTGRTTQSIYSYETGRRLPSVALLATLAHLYGTTVDAIAGRQS